MSDTPIRRTNWTASQQASQGEDPLAELERIVGRSGAPTPPAPAKPPVSAPQNNNELPPEDFLGFSADEFENAFRSLEQQASPPVREGLVFKKEPVFEEAPPQTEYSRSFAQTYQDELSGVPQPREQEREQEFETRADAFDFDTRAIETAQPVYRGNYDYEPASSDDAEPAYYLENRPRSGFVTVIAVTGLVFVAVIGALVYSWVGAKNTGAPVTITADKTPVKKMAAADAEQPAQNKLIYDRLGSADDTNNEKLVSREEQPVDNLNTQAPGNTVAPVTEEQAAMPASPRVILPNPSAQETGTLNAPREVATTTIRVRPDGTMENIPAIADTAPAQQTPTVVKPKIVAAPPPVKATVPAIAAPPPPADETTAAEEATPEPVITPPTPAKIVTKPQRVASVRPAATTVPSAGAGFVVQVSSQKSQDSARASFSSMQARFPQVLAGYQPSIKPVTLGDKGTFYRVRVGPMASRDEAASLCGRLKAAGGDCVVTPN